MVYAEEYETVQAAIRRERQLKGWTARKKEALIIGDVTTLKLLSRKKAEARRQIVFTWQELIDR